MKNLLKYNSNFSVLKSIKELLILLIVVFSIQSSISQELKRINASNFITVIKLDQNAKSNNLMKAANNKVDFLLEKNELYQSFMGENSIYLENFPIGENNFGNLRLYYSEPAYDENTVINVYYQGKVTQAKLPDFKLYSGTIDGDTESDVIMIVSKNGISGIVQTGYGNSYNLGLNIENNSKISEIQVANNNNLYTLVLSDRAELDHNAGVTNTCGVSDIEQNPNGYGDGFLGDFNDDFDLNHKRNSTNNGLLGTEILEATIAMEGNHEFFLMFKNNKNDPDLKDLADNQQAITRGIEYMTQVMSMSSLVYRRELNITLKIGNIDFYADKTKDPYFPLFNQILSAKLNRMRTVWSGRSSIKRTVVSLFTNLRSQPANSTIAGIAYVGSPRTGVLCSTGQGYNALGMIGSFMYPTMNFTTDVNVTAHELGHNFSSPHTHNCYFKPQIDTCLTQETNPNTDACIEEGSLRRIKFDGDIMSYCFLSGGSILRFHPRIKELMRAAAITAKTKCVTVPTGRVLQLVQPKGQEKYVSNEIINISWNVANVGRIKILFSSNGGETWESIANDLNAVTDSIYKWKTPDIDTRNALVRIVDMTNETVLDESITPFEIQKRGIEILFPAEGQGIGFNTETNILWSKTVINNIRLKYSWNGGKDWTTILENVNTFNLSYNFADSTVNNAVLRIESIDNPEFFSIVNFKIGMEKVDFIVPNIETILCDSTKSMSFEFTSDFADKIVLWVSFDGKKNWRRSHVGFIDANKGTHLWNSNSIIASDSVFIKVTPFGASNDLIIGEAGPFIIKECVDLTSVEELPIFLDNLSPNPADDKVTISLGALPNIKININEIRFQITTITGAVIKEFKANDNVVNGKIEMDVRDLAQGTYLVTMIIDNKVSNKNLQIIRK